MVIRVGMDVVYTVGVVSKVTHIGVQIVDGHPLQKFHLVVVPAQILPCPPQCTNRKPGWRVLAEIVRVFHYNIASDRLVGYGNGQSGIRYITHTAPVLPVVDPCFGVTAEMIADPYKASQE